MITENELRVGNYLQKDLEIFRVDEIKFNGVEYVARTYMDDSYNSFKEIKTNSLYPISLLDPGVLEACKYIHNESFDEFYPGKKVYQCIQDKIHGNTSLIENIGGARFFTMINPVTNTVIVKRIDSVHQLQNIIYFITNEELKVDISNIKLLPHIKFVDGPRFIRL